MTTLLGRQLVYVTGKGGVGKTTVAAAIALAAAREGRRTVVIETGGQHRLPGLWGEPVVPAGRELRLEERVWSLTVDHALALEEWFGTLIPRRLVGVLTHSAVFRQFADAAPGARELITMAKAWELVQEQRWDRRRRPYDLVVVDAPASGHGVGMLRAPGTFADIARIGPLHTQAQRVREWLQDSRRTTFAAVALPAEMPVQETLDLEGRLQRALGRDLGAIVVNGLLPPRFDPAELEIVRERLNSRTPAEEAARQAALTEAAQAATQAEQLARLHAAARAPVRTLPFVFRPALGLEEVRDLAEALRRQVADG